MEVVRKQASKYIYYYLKTPQSTHTSIPLHPTRYYQLLLPPHTYILISDPTLSDKTRSDANTSAHQAGTPSQGKKLSFTKNPTHWTGC
jgi:hypothetical protein